jgi:hypothetical protein
MGSIGDTAELSEARIMTWWQARKWLDAQFIRYRNDILSSGQKNTVIATWLDIHQTRWKEAAEMLKRSCLPQRKTDRKTRAVHTINPKVGSRKKAKPSHSLIARRKRQTKLGQRPRTKSKRHKSARALKGRTLTRQERSHHPFNSRTGIGYYPVKAGPGRPAYTPEQRKAARKKRNRKAEEKRKKAVAVRRKKAGLKAYAPKRKPEVIQRAKIKAEARTTRLRAARKAWHEQHKERMEKNGGSRWKDDRKNHHPELAYLSPIPRQRGKGKRHFHRVKSGVGKRIAAAGLLAIRAALKAKSRSVHLRGYWNDVHRLAEGKAGK